MTEEGEGVLPFALRLEEAPEGTTVWASGDLDLAAASALRATLKAATRHRRRVVLDLTAVEFLDGAGIGAIVAAAKEGGPGTEIVLRHPNALATRVLQITGLDHVFQIEA